MYDLNSYANIGRNILSFKYVAIKTSKHFKLNVVFYLLLKVSIAIRDCNVCLFPYSYQKKEDNNNQIETSMTKTLKNKHDKNVKKQASINKCTKLSYIFIQHMLKV